MTIVIGVTFVVAATSAENVTFAADNENIAITTALVAPIASHDPAAMMGETKMIKIRLKIINV